MSKRPYAFFNDIDPQLCEWLRELMKLNVIMEGEVFCGSIDSVTPSDLDKFTQCHFFAGIGVWSYALRQAGWPDERPIWTGSCPCQPFSSAGKGVGFADERHLWPAFEYLIGECKPITLIGEQVASKDGLAWLDLVLSDLEGQGYAAGAIDSCAAGFGAPHIRQRLYWLAHADDQRQLTTRDGTGSGIVGGQSQTVRLDNSSDCRRQLLSSQRGEHGALVGQGEAVGNAGGRCHLIGLAHAASDRRLWKREGREIEERLQPRPESARELPSGLEGRRATSGMADANGDRREARVEGSSPVGQGGSVVPDRSVSFVADASLAGSQGHGGLEQEPVQAGRQGEERYAGSRGLSSRPDATNGFWGSVDWLFCRDGKWRAVESKSEPLADGLADRLGYSCVDGRYALNPLIEKGKVENRAMRLKGYGNAIVAEQATEFVYAVKEILDGR